MTISKLIRPRLGRLTLAFGILALVVLSNPSANTNRRAGLLPPDVASLVALYGAETAASIDRKARDFKLPDQVDWQGRAGSVTKTAILLGDPAKPGLYVQLLQRGPDDWSQPHSHANERFITVLKGTFLIGTGAKLDRNNTVALKPGSFVRDIANQMHYDGTGPEGVTLQIVGIGPSAMIQPEAK